MDIPFRVTISKNQLTAKIERNKQNQIDEDFSISVGTLETYLNEQKVIFGIEQQKLKEIEGDPKGIKYPVVIAEGNPPINGEDAYMIMEFQKEEAKKKEIVNFREVLDIPSVKNGQVIASIIPQTLGVNGKGVTGKLIPAKDGKPLRIQAGKNVVKEGLKFLSTIDGQVSVTQRVISVNPVFEVKGDLDLKTGNVNFIGNVIIRGNVPTGYEVIAGGDIKIYGLVEGAQLVARGNIFISGGITGGKKSKIVAGGSIQANFLNQADVRAGQDVIISTSSLHSTVEAKQSILCKNGHVIGGVLRSGSDIHVKELGNHLYTKTELIVGYDPSLEKKEAVKKEEISQVSDNINKLEQIEKKLIESAKAKGNITEEEKTLILKQRATKNQLINQLGVLHKQIEELETEKVNRGNHCVYVYDKVYPNTSLNFGKYTKMVQTTHSYVRFFIRNSEIAFEPLG
jgi:uncharacterized protein